MKTIGETYQHNHLALEKLAMIIPEHDTQHSSVTDIAEFRLLQNQEKLLELAVSLQVSNLDDVCDILKFWHQVTVQDLAHRDLSPSDALIMVIYNYFTQQHQS